MAVMNHAHADSLLAALALHAVDAPEKAPLLAHLRGCARCQAALARLRAPAGLLTRTLRPLAPPPALRARLLASLARQAAPRLTRSSQGGLVDASPVTGPGPLAEGSLLQAGPKGRLEVQFPGQAVAVLMDGARARLQRWRRQWQLRLEAGQAMIHVHPGQPFRTWTPLATVQVKGTWYFARVESRDRAYVCLCEGWIGLSGPGLKRDLKAGLEHGPGHLAVQLTRQGGRTVLRPASSGHPHPTTGPVLTP
jgi:hypothetical protein